MINVFDTVATIVALIIFILGATSPLLVPLFCLWVLLKKQE